ncbi:hypothetical protein ABFS83_05G076100 [Erythranthe nasuta]
MNMKYKIDKSDFEYCIVICWAIWHARNKRVFEDVHRSALDVIVLAKKFLAHVRDSAEVLRTKLGPSARTLNSSWEAPPRDEVQINFDASLTSADHGCRLSGLARSADGSCLGWFSTWSSSLLQPRQCLPLKP